LSAAGEGWDCVGAGAGGRDPLADRELHGRDLLHLVDDDFLGDPPQLLALAIAHSITAMSIAPW